MRACAFAPADVDTAPGVHPGQVDLAAITNDKFAALMGRRRRGTKGHRASIGAGEGQQHPAADAGIEVGTHHRPTGWGNNLGRLADVGACRQALGIQ